MEHGFFGVHRDDTWYDHDIDRGQTGFASMVPSGSRPASDATYSGTMFAANPGDWEQAAYQGDADVRFHLDTNVLDVEFSNVVSLHNGARRDGLSWLGLPVAPDGTFSGTGDTSSCPLLCPDPFAAPLRDPDRRKSWEPSLPGSVGISTSRAPSERVASKKPSPDLVPWFDWAVHWRDFLAKLR